MQLKNSLVLLTAMTAGSAVGRMHGHERRHAHHQEHKRNVGDMVYAKIDGKIQSWVNEYSGQAATSAATTTAVSVPTVVVSSSASAAVSASATATASSSPTLSTGSCKNWHDTKENESDYLVDIFGSRTQSNMKEYIDYAGNVGSPYGSNIREVSESKACEYKHVVRIDGSEKEPWTVGFWNKMGPDGKLTGWYGNAVLTLQIHPGESKYVAFDDDTQGAWGIAKGNELPKDQYGGYACTWGEFDFSNTHNKGWSGWDVSAIQAQKANMEVQGMKICDHTGSKCSTISNFAKFMENAYSALEAGLDGIGGNSVAGPVRLQVTIDFD
ncbi:hypothetical protein BDV25DRAFT_19589 [Aspergillus avenaceus]|uniref:Allergen Asp f 4 n=1 Tax=Aspergillus avenaceus TaxID=36643 RepID=A0A5N6TPN3_ASPAV|nr:hypothetical protein BDV25DRAFT_19589 [Aspergillus avenaceus]